MATTDWSNIRADYVTGQLSLQDLATKWRVSFDNLKKRCQGEKWVRERDAYRARVYNESVAHKGKTAVNELIELNEIDLIISKGIREMIRSKLDTMITAPDEHSITDMATLARCHKDVQFVGRMATGADTTTVKEGVANKDKRDYSADELRERLSILRSQNKELH